MHFEPKVDFECLSALTTLATKGELLEKKHEALDHCFFLAGGVNAYFSESNRPPIFGATGEDAETHEAMIVSCASEAGMTDFDTESVEDLATVTKHFCQANTATMSPVLAALIAALVKAVLDKLIS